MTELSLLIDRYIETFNETDAARRRVLIAATWTGSARYVDPVMQGEGQDGIDSMIRGVQDRFPGHRFQRIGDVDAHNDRVRFSWELLPPNGPALVKGTDFGVVDQGRLSAITGFFDQLPS